ncbi:MAG TPA: hypothetical protein VFW45_07005 [Candidatus Polarisedimenticolia bacterium]|nr:hypothetical protein [Candidatus Polarisedimenticolia bacterium]
MNRAWELLSRSGHEKARWNCAVPEGGEESRLVCDVVLTGAGLPEALASGTGSEDGSGFSLSFPGLEVSVAGLARLSALLGEWIGLPAPERAGRRLGIDCDMGSLFDRRLMLRIGERADTVSGGFPVATLSYSAGRLTGEFSFLTDEQRLEALRAGLESALGPRA